jgi:pimeloyl-ACP methyl ester carboxylesterase
MDITIKRFGRAEREMVGVLQHSRRGQPPRARCLMCRPLGQEAVRAASAFRVLSERMSREGCDVLRFDYHGTGDSPGEEQDQSIDGWVEDILAAHEQLQTGAPAHVNWFGMGLGATLAVRAAARAKQAPKNLVLWEPVLDGPTYLKTLLAAHRAELSREFGVPWDRLLRQGKATEPTAPGDVLGFHIGERLASDLAGLGMDDLGSVLQRGIRVTCAVHEEDKAAVHRLAAGRNVQVHIVEARTDWMSSQALGTAIVPVDLPRVLISNLD